MDWVLAIQAGVMTALFVGTLMGWFRIATLIEQKLGGYAAAAFAAISCGALVGVIAGLPS